MQLESSPLFRRSLCPRRHTPTTTVKQRHDRLPRLARWFGGIAAVAGLIGCGQPVEESAVESAAYQDSPFLVIAHRGASAQRPEHTIACLLYTSPSPRD